MSYRLHPRRGVIRTASGEHIPDRSHPGWPAYAAWLRAGNTPDAVEVALEPLALLYDRVRSSIKVMRNEVEQAGFVFAGRPIDSDVASAIRISGAAASATAAAALGAPWTVEWTCQDNSVLPLDALGMIGLMAALAQHADAVHQHARNLKAQAEVLYLAADRAGLEALDITAGWPVGGDP